MLKSIQLKIPEVKKRWFMLIICSLVSRVSGKLLHLLIQLDEYRNNVNSCFWLAVFDICYLLINKHQSVFFLADLRAVD